MHGSLHLFVQSIKLCVSVIFNYSYQSIRYTLTELPSKLHFQINYIFTIHMCKNLITSLNTVSFFHRFKGLFSKFFFYFFSISFTCIRFIRFGNLFLLVFPVFLMFFMLLMFFILLFLFLLYFTFLKKSI